VHGGETDDALLIHVPERGVVFAGDVLMPHLGAPFFPEGSAEGLFESLQLIEDLQPSVLIHGHAPLTANFTIGTIPGLRKAFEDLYQVVREDVRVGRSVFEILDRNHLPDVLRSHPDSVLGYVILRDNIIRRVQRQRTGYWQPEVESIEPASPTEWAAVLDILTGGTEGTYVRTLQDLLDRDDLPLAHKLADLVLLNHPDSKPVAELRQQALRRLIERHQGQAPFKFIIYSELADLAIPAIVD
jgi:hypothetical protein